MKRQGLSEGQGFVWEPRRFGMRYQHVSVGCIVADAGAQGTPTYPRTEARQLHPLGTSQYPGGVYSEIITTGGLGKIPGGSPALQRVGRCSLRERASGGLESFPTPGRAGRTADVHD